MAGIIVGSSIPKILTLLFPSSQKFLTSQISSNVALNFSRSICGKNNRDPDFKRIPPFPYKEKKYTLLKSLFDRTSYRFDENSKIIVVDGAVAAGKTEFAKRLAEELDMLYMPEADMDFIYINPYGYDMRQLDPKLPPSCRSFDVKNFCKDPNHTQTAYLQFMLYKIKFVQYIDALAHVMNTGQGVVMDKSIYSDHVYIEALAKEGFISKLAKSVYYDVKRHTIDELIRPHLAIYLDVPVPKILEKVKQRGRPHEQNSKAMSTSFLSALEDGYKRQYLKEISIHAELLIYDWSDGGDVEVVVEDIERLDFDKYTEYDKKLEDWRFPKEQALADARMKYTNDKLELLSYFNVPRYDCPELLVDGEDMKQFLDVWWHAPGMRYDVGYQPGDKNVLFAVGPKQKFTYSSHLI